MSAKRPAPKPGKGKKAVNRPAARKPAAAKPAARAKAAAHARKNMKLTTETTAPSQFATRPASSSPSCGPPMKNTMFTPIMRPRM